MREEKQLKPDLLGFTEAETVDFCLKQGLPRFRGKQLFQWIQQKSVVDYGQMTNIPKAMAEVLADGAILVLPKIRQEQVSKDGTTAKLLLEFGQKTLVEVVIMLYDRQESRNRQTICISTQAGCAMGCTFCATGIGGLERNLTGGEIVAQVIVGNIWCQGQGFAGISNVVYMGMGEPLANFDAVLHSIRILNEENGLQIGQRRITVSTCGLIPQLKKLADQKLSIGVAISLHAPVDDIRTTLMPINKNYPIKELLLACEYYTAKTGRRMSYEYALLKEVNDTPELAHRLGKLLKGKLAHINIIPVNLVEETGFHPSDSETVKEFANILVRYNIETTVREKRGIDIDAACGQLRKRAINACEDLGC